MSKPLLHNPDHLRGIVLELSSAISMVDHSRHDRQEAATVEVRNADLDHVVEHLCAATQQYRKASRTVQRVTCFMRLALHTEDMPEHKRWRLLYRAVRMLEKVM